MSMSNVTTKTAQSLSVAVDASLSDASTCNTRGDPYAVPSIPDFPTIPELPMQKIEEISDEFHILLAFSNENPGIEGQSPAIPSDLGRDVCLCCKINILQQKNRHFSIENHHFSDRFREVQRQVRSDAVSQLDLLEGAPQVSDVIQQAPRRPDALRPQHAAINIRQVYIHAGD